MITKSAGSDTAPTWFPRHADANEPAAMAAVVLLRRLNGGLDTVRLAVSASVENQAKICALSDEPARPVAKGCRDEDRARRHDEYTANGGRRAPLGDY